MSSLFVSVFHLCLIRGHLLLSENYVHDGAQRTDGLQDEDFVSMDCVVGKS